MEQTATAQPLEPRRMRFVAAAAAATLVAGAFVGPVGAAVSPGHLGHLDPGLTSVVSGTVRVIVQAEQGAVGQAKRAVEKLRGSIWTMLPVVDGFSATVPASRLDRLVRDPSVRAVTADRAAKLTSLGADAGAPTGASPFVQDTGADKAWAADDQGQGVAVAVIDTGISPMSDFGTRVVYGPDLSGEANIVDTFGHGTVMAGIIGGSGADSNGLYSGVAPKVTLVSVKTAGRDGSTDLAKILAAMGWISTFAHQYNIRVVNLSWGIPSTQDVGFDPLDYAVDHLWRQGIVVVAAAGNDGEQSGSSVLKPGDDPTIITAGAYDDGQNTNPSDDTVPAWSARGAIRNGSTKPDVVAPGVNLVATRSFGSYIADTYQSALRAPSYIRGSGTSQATAVTSGLAALLLSAHPELSPDQVKNLLVSNASPISGVDPAAQGAGRVQLPTVSGHTASTRPHRAAAASAHDRGCDPGLTLTKPGRGQSEDIGCALAQWLGSMWSNSRWTGSMWSGSMWSGSMWSGSMWSNATWNGSMWSGGTWLGSMWSGSMWSGSMWSGSMWSGSMWSGSMWSGSMWSGSMWSGSMWSGSMWSGSMWSGSMWSGSMWSAAYWGDAPGGDAGSS